MDEWGYQFQFLASAHHTPHDKVRESQSAVSGCASLNAQSALPGVLGRWRTLITQIKISLECKRVRSDRSSRSHLASTPDLRGPHTSFVNRIAHTSKKLKKSGGRMDRRAHTIFSLDTANQWFQDGSQKKKSQTKKNLAYSDVSAQTRRPSISFPSVSERSHSFFCNSLDRMTECYRGGGQALNAHTPRLLWWCHCGINCESGNTSLTLCVQSLL
jgi:hypothetical protein